MFLHYLFVISQSQSCLNTTRLCKILMKIRNCLIKEQVNKITNLTTRLMPAFGS